jgi:putative hemolysin
MDLSWEVIAAVLICCAAGSFFFALAESALFALGKWRAQRMAESGAKGGKEVYQLLEEAPDLLGTLALGNTFSNAAMVGITTWLILKYHLAPLVPLLWLLLLILVGCEVLPKTLGVRAPEFWSLRLVTALRAVVFITRPVRQIAQSINGWLVRTFTPKSVKPQMVISEEEYQELLEMAYQQGALAQSEKEIILQILSLDRRTAGDVMKARSQLTLVPDDLSKDEMVELAVKARHSRLPMYDETPDTIIGVLNARGLLLNPDADLEEVIEFPSFVPESMNLLQLLKSLQRQRRGIAIVLDEFGSTAGVVSMEDILQEMLGPFRHEHDAPEFIIEKLGTDRWRVNGVCRIDHFQREYPDIGDIDEVDTMGGLALQQFEYVPAQGESVLYRGLRLTAQAVDERRIRELVVERVKR